MSPAFYAILFMGPDHTRFHPRDDRKESVLPKDRIP